MITKLLCTLWIALISITSLQAKLLINEIAITTTSDWVELFYAADQQEHMDISKLYVTMYYGNNEPLGDSPITIFSYDRPETPWDDRFVVVHLTEPGKPDETDLTGDTNQNGYIDIYCNNYSGSLWNTEGVVAIDTDDNPANGGIIDFVAYSNRDGSANETVASYINHAHIHNAWQGCNGNTQLCAVDIGLEGIESYMSIIRKTSNDNNGPDDFCLTKYQTPGKVNIQSYQQKKGRLFKSLKRKIIILPGHDGLAKKEIPLLLYENCTIKIRIYSTIGQNIYSSPLYKEMQPGPTTFSWNTTTRLTTGLYLCKIEAYDTKSKISQAEIIYIINSHYK